MRAQHATCIHGDFAARPGRLPASRCEGMNPLPENAPRLEMTKCSAGRGQASSALDAYYVDGWLDLEQAAGASSRAPAFAQIDARSRGLETEARGRIRSIARGCGQAPGGGPRKNATGEMSDPAHHPADSPASPARQIDGKGIIGKVPIDARKICQFRGRSAASMAHVFKVSSRLAGLQGERISLIHG